MNMCQPPSPSKPAAAAATAYLKAAAQVLRLQKALNRSSGKKSSNGGSSNNATSTSISAPCTPTTPSFQHSNGRRLSYNQYLHHHHSTQHGHHPHNHHSYYYRSEHYDTPLYAMQRRRNTSGNIPSNNYQQYSTTAKHTTKDVLVYSNVHQSSSSKISRRSGPPSLYSVHTIHHNTQHVPSTASSVSSLSRSNSLPNRRRKRLSYQATVMPLITQQPDHRVSASSATHTGTTTITRSSRVGPKPKSSAFTEDRTVSRPRPQLHVQEYSPRPAAVVGHCGSDTGEAESHAAIQAQHRTAPARTTTARTVARASIAASVGILPGEPVISASPPSSPTRATYLRSATANVSMVVQDMRRSSGLPPIPIRTRSNSSTAPLVLRTTIGSGAAVSPTAATFSFGKPSRSMTNTSLSSNSSMASTAMRLIDSSMSIQSQRSHMSESSMLSAAMTASGLPSMDVMMGQVDKSLATDSQAQLMENAHVGLVAHVLVVNRHLIAEPCSAAIETWVN